MLGEGLSLKQALIKAGYSEQTARCPGSHGLSAEECFDSLKESEGKALPATIREDTRKLLQKAVRRADPVKTSLASIARTAEIVERWYGEGRRMAPDYSKDAGEFVDKVEWLQGVLDELAQRNRAQSVRVIAEENADSEGSSEAQNGRLQITASHDAGPTDVMPHDEA